MADRLYKKRNAEEHLYAFDLLAPLSGGSKSLLVLGTGLNVWVVKFLKNPQNPLQVITEYLVAQIANRLGLSIPENGFIVVSQEVLAKTHIRVDPRYHQPGLHFASRYVLDPNRTIFTRATPRPVGAISNGYEALGVLVLDIWLGNADYRQAVFSPSKSGKHSRAWWIDHGLCLGAGMWKQPDWDSRGMFSSEVFRDHLSDLALFQEWIKTIESFPVKECSAIVNLLPQEFVLHSKDALSDLIALLDLRRQRLRQIVHKHFLKRLQHETPSSAFRSPAFCPVALADALEI